MNPLRSLFGQTAIYGLGTVLPRLLNYLLLTPFFTRVFKSGEYGIVTELYAYVVFLMILLTYGMETGFFRYASKNRRSGEVFDTSIISLFVTSFLFALTVGLFSEGIAGFIGYSDHPEYIVWIGLIVSIDAFVSIPFARLRLEGKAIRFAAIKIASVLVNVLLNLLFLWVLPSYASADNHGIIQLIYNEDIGVGYVFISNLIASGFTLLLLAGELIRTKLDFSIGLWKSMIIYSLPLLFSGLAGTINEALDRVLLKHLLSGDMDPMAELGIYGANYKLAVLMTLFVQMFRYASEPFYFNRYKDKGSLKLFSDVMKYFIIAGLIIYMGVILYLDVFKYFIGPSYHEGLRIVPVVLFANLLLGIFFNLSIWYKLKNITKFAVVLTGGGAIITFIVNWFFIPVYGYVASAWAHLICYAFMVTASYILGRKYLPVKYDLKQIVFYIAGCFILIKVASLIEVEKLVLQLIVNTGFLLAFVGYVLVNEGFIRRNNNSFNK